MYRYALVNLSDLENQTIEITSDSRDDSFGLKSLAPGQVAIFEPRSSEVDINARLVADDNLPSEPAEARVQQDLPNGWVLRSFPKPQAQEEEPAASAAA